MTFSSVRHGATSGGAVDIVRQVVQPEFTMNLGKLEDILSDLGRAIKMQSLPREIPEVKVTVPTPEVFVSVPTPSVHIDNKAPDVHIAAPQITVRFPSWALITVSAMPTIAILLDAYCRWRWH